MTMTYDIAVIVDQDYLTMYLKHYTQSLQVSWMDIYIYITDAHVGYVNMTSTWSSRVQLTS